MNRSVEEILSRLMRSASERWGENECVELKPALTTFAEAISIVDGFSLGPEEEPAQRIDLSKSAIRAKGAGA